MIFRTEKLQELKNIEYQSTNPEIKSLKQKILNDVWPQSENHHFCQAIESIALKWLNQFVTLIEKWLSQTSSKYISKFTNTSQLKRPQDKDQFYQYVMNLSKYIHSMEHPLITSINNIQSLYLKFPSDQLIQQPKKTLLNKSASSESSPLKKKKSLSIQSFTSNIPTKSRSRSRKITFFNTVKPNIFQTFAKQIKKPNQNLNTTIKKVKKELPFTKTSSTFHSYPNQHIEKQNYPSSHVQADGLRQKLQKRLSNTCSSTFFNQIVMQQSLSREQSFVNDYTQPIISQKPQRQAKESFVSKNDRKQLEQDLKKSILQELDKKDKSNYEYFLKDIENKLSNKFDALLNKILQQKQSNEKKQASVNQKENQKDTGENGTKKTVSQQSLESLTINNLNQQQSFSKKTSDKNKLSSNSKSEKTNELTIPQTINKQPSISNMIKCNRQSSDPIHEASPIEEVKPVEIKKDSKVNTSVIVQKDSSKIIKSKSRSNSIVKETKENVVPKNNLETSQGKYSVMPKSYKSSLDRNDSIDSIQIQDSPINSAVFTNPKPILTTAIQPENKKPTSIIQNAKVQPVPKQQDNFYMKRIKQLKNKMQTSIKNYKIASDKLILPVNQTFMLIFSISYQQFCELNSLPINSQQVTDTFSKYKSKPQMKSKKPENDEKFLMDSLMKIQKMINLKCPPEKKIKIQEYTEKCIQCIQNVYFEKPDLKLNDETLLTQKLQEIKVCLSNSNNI